MQVLNVRRRNLLYLSHELVRNGSQELGLVVLGANNVSLDGLLGEALALGSGLAGLLGLLLDLLVLLDAVQEVLAAGGVLDVLNPDGDPLGQDPALDSLVDDDTNGVLGDVEDAASLAVVGLVWHTLLEGTVALDVDDVAGLVATQVGGEMLDALALVGARERI